MDNERKFCAVSHLLPRFGRRHGMGRDWVPLRVETMQRGKAFSYIVRMQEGSMRNGRRALWSLFWSFFSCLGWTSSSSPASSLP